ncbi:hypothetical protein BIW19_17200 [Pseudomonas putida]|nr:hypothetical protein BIW19_17200 [Pseudomonas putida]
MQYLCLRPQLRVGVHRHRMRHPLQQRQIVHRVAIEIAVLKVEAVLQHPALQPRHLAFTETRYIGTTSGIAAITRFAFGRQQHANPQASGNRCGDEAVGGGDDHQLVAGLAVLLQQAKRLWQDDRLDAVAHEIMVPFVELGYWCCRKDFHGKGQVGLQVQGAVQVFLIEAIVALLVGNRVEDAALAKVVTPGMVAVATEEGIVQVE